MSPSVHERTLPPSKRQKIASAESGTNAASPKITISEKGGEEASAIPPHPLRIKPNGNSYTSALNLRDTSTGLFAICPDELILEVLECLDATSLALLGTTSKAFCAFSRHEELWKTLFIEYVFSTTPVPQPLSPKKTSSVFSSKLCTT